MCAKIYNTVRVPVSFIEQCPSFLDMYFLLAYANRIKNSEPKLRLKLELSAIIIPDDVCAIVNSRSQPNFIWNALAAVSACGMSFS